MTELLELRRVSARYQQIPALTDVSLKIRSQQVTAVIGVNGAGKTTALKVMAGVMPITDGEVYFQGERCPRRGTGVIRKGVGFSPEGRRLFGEMSVADNLRVGAFRVRRAAEVEARLQYVYELFPRLAERRSQKAGTLSGGEQQMAAIGRALMPRPTLLLLDEPTLGLSPKLVGVVADIVRTLRSEDTSIVLVEQNATVALALADFAYVLDAGRVVAEGNAEELRRTDLVRATYLDPTRHGTTRLTTGPPAISTEDGPPPGALGAADAHD